MLYRLVWLIDFFEIQSLEGGDICYKRDEILKKKSNLVYFCSIFLTEVLKTGKYNSLPLFRGSMGFLRAGYGLDKVYHIRYNHSFRQTYPENKFNLCGFLTWCKIYQLMKGLEYVLKINTQYFQVTIQKKTNYVGWKVVILNFQPCHVYQFSTF